MEIFQILLKTCQMGAKSILSQTSAWPELPTKPAPVLKHVPAATVTSASRPPGMSAASNAAAAAPSISLLATPATSGASAAAAPASVVAASSPLPAARASSSPPTPSRDSFFDDDEAALEHRWNKSQQAARAAAAAAAAEAGADGAAAAAAAMPPKPIQPGTSAPAMAAAAAASVDGVYYFYQSADGQQLYLHSLPYRALLHEAGGSVAALPPRIRGRVSHLDSYVQDNLVRSKLRFLSHLPLTANFRLGLVDLGSLNPPLSRGTLSALASEVAAEKKARATAARKQKELNKRTQALATRAREEEGINNPHARGNAPHEWQAAANFDATAFPDLANPLGFASGAPSVPDAAAAAAVGADSSAVMSAGAGPPELKRRGSPGASVRPPRA
jgi:hypothetical protein